MSSVSVRVLNQETARVLAQVKSGEEIELTERGVVIARIVPSSPAPTAALYASGKFRAPTASGPMPRPHGAVRDNDEAGALVREMRDEERY
ncbi:type II toxin-antitoxin system Phd/YefM family antitoxin [Murinocardiopsis flavida]|nr:prevent-host-death family protein [Murinocardiopsis flavida]